MKFIIIGPAQAGKSTAGRMLAEILQTRATDTSEPITRVETARIDGMLPPGPSVEDSPEWDHDRARPKRANLIATGDALKLLSPTILVDYCFRQGDICVGVRRKDELDAAKRKYPDAKVLWVQADNVVDDNFDCEITQADYLLWNRKNGESKLKHEVAAVAVMSGALDTEPAAG